MKRLKIEMHRLQFKTDTGRGNSFWSKLVDVGRWYIDLDKRESLGDNFAILTFLPSVVRSKE
jgi:hypothetical protein